MGENVVSGSAAFDRSNPASLIINQSSDKVIIHWQDFSIAAGELTKFIQPSATAAALNRVTSGNISKIYGTLEANGHIYLVNPNGVLVGPSGQINAMSFMASTLAVENQSFLDGRPLTLSGDSKAAVVNQGRIEALGGDVFLIAHTVENSGAIVAPDGTVGLAAGSEVILQPASSGSERIGVLLGSSGDQATGTGVNNQGNIQAATAELKAAGGNVYALAINNGGMVRADSIVRENGRIVLKAAGGNIQNSGTLAAHAAGDGGQVVLDGGRGAEDNPSTVVNTGTIDVAGTEPGSVGGQVSLLGDQVGVTGQALLDASGDAGGGSILVGGDYQGNNPDVQNALRTYVGPDAVLKADATGSGAGGQVIVWADQITRFLGSIFARGGGEGGDGGFAEVSGHESLVAHGTVDLTAPRGDMGTVLYDPLDIVIIGGSMDGSDSPEATSGSLNETALGSVNFAAVGDGTMPFEVYESEIEGTGAHIVLMAANQITVSGTFNNDADGGGTLDPGNNVVLLQNGFNLTLQTRNNAADGNSGINLTGVSGLEFRTQGSGTILIESGIGVDASTAPVTVGKLTTSIGSITINAEGTLTVDGDLTTGNLVGSPGNDVTTGSISLNSLNSAIQINANVATGQATVSDANAVQAGRSGTIDVTSATDITLAATKSIQSGNVVWLTPDSGNGDTSDSGTITLMATGAGGITLNGSVRTGNADIAGSPGGNSSDHDTATTGNVVLSTANGAISINDNISTGVATVGDGAGAQNGRTGNIMITAAGTLTLAATKSIQSGNADWNLANTGNDTSVSGNIALTATGNNAITLNGTVKTGNAVMSDQGGASNNDDSAVTGNVTIIAGTSVTGAGQVETGRATLNGAAFVGTDFATSGDISVTAGMGGVSGGIGLSAPDAALKVGIAERIDAGAGTDTASTGDIRLNSRDEVNNGLVSTPLSLLIQKPEGAGTGNQGSLRSATLGVLGHAFITSAEDLFLEMFTTAAASVQTIEVATSGGKDITVTSTAEVLSGDTVTLDAGSGTLTVADNNYNIGAGTLTLSGSEVELTGGNNSIIGVGGTLIIRPGTAAGEMELGGTTIPAALNITTTEINALANGFNSIILGRTADGTGAFTVTGQASFSDNLTLAGGSIAFNEAVTSTGNAVTLLARTGGITDNHTGVDLVADTLSATAETGISLDTTIGTLILADVNMTGAIDISDSAGGLIVTSATTADGNVILAAAGGNLDVTVATAGGAGSDVMLTTTGAGSVRVGDVTADDVITINSAAAIEELAAVDAGADLTAASLALTSVSGIGTLDTLEVDTATLTTAGASAAGAIDIAEVSGGLIVSAASTFNGNLTLAAPGTLELGDITAAGQLNATAGGDITQTASTVISATGNATFTTTAAAADSADILLNAGNNNFAMMVAIAENTAGALRDVALRNVTMTPQNPAIPTDLNDLTLEFPMATLTIPASGIILKDIGLDTGDLNLVAGGMISQLGTLTVSGTTTLTAGSGNNIALGLNNDFQGPVTIVSGNNVTLVDQDSITLGGPSTVSGLLDVTADAIDLSGVVTANAVDFDASGGAGDITDSGAGSLRVTTTTTLAAQPTDNIILDDTGNDFDGAVQVTGANDVTLVDADTITLGASTVGGTLDVTANGIDINGGLVTANAVDFNATGGAGDITDTGLGQLQVTTTTTLAGQATDNITLDNGANDFQGAVQAASGNNVTLVDDNDITLLASTVSGTLDVTADSIDVSGGLVMANAVDFDATGGAGGITDTGLGRLQVATTTTLAGQATDNITLDNGANDFQGAVSALSGNNVTLADANTIQLGMATVSGALDVTALTEISQNNSPLVVTMGSTFRVTSATADTADILLAGADNNFMGGLTLVEVTPLSLRDVAVRNVSASAGALVIPTDLNDLTLQFPGTTITIPAGGIILKTLGPDTGDLNLLAGGLIDQLGFVDISGTTTLEAGAANNILLGDPANNFQGAVAVTSGNNVTLEDVNTITLGAMNVSGNLDVTAGGDINQTTAPIAVTGTSTFTLTSGVADSVNLSLASADNVFAMGVAIVESTAGALLDVELRNLTMNAQSPLIPTDLNDLTLQFPNAMGLTIPLAGITLKDVGPDTGDLNLEVNGLIQQLGSLTISGTTTLAAGAANNIVLNDPANDFGGAVTVASGNNVILVDSTGFVLGPSTIAGTLDVTADAIDITGGLVMANAVDFDATTGPGNITDTGAGRLQVTTTTTLAALATDNITLDNPANDFQGQVRVLSGNNATLVDGGSISLGASTVGGTLDVTADAIEIVGGLVRANAVDFDATTGAGNITDTGAGQLQVTTTTTLSAQTGDDITLDNTANDFQGQVRVLSGNNATLVDGGSISLGASVVSGTLDVTANAIDVASGLVQANAVDFDASTGPGNITDTGSGQLQVSTTTLLQALNTDTISLNNPLNEFQGAVSVVAANNVTLADATGITLGPSTVSGTLDVTADGIDVNGGLVSAGAVNFNATGGAGGITDTGLGRLQVTTTTLLSAPTGENITLDNPANDFQGAVSVPSANNVTLVDANALVLGASTIQGLLDVTADSVDILGGLVRANALDIDVTGGAGGISDSGAGQLQVTTTTTLAGQATDNLILNNPANDFQGAVTITSGNNVTLADDNAIILGPSTVSGTLVVTADSIDVNGGLVMANAVDFDASGGVGGITDSGAGRLQVSTTTTLAGQVTDDIQLNNPANDFQGAVSVTSGNNVTLVDVDALILGASTVAGTFDASGTALTVGGLLMAGQAILTGTTLTLNNAINTGLGTVTLNHSGALTGAGLITAGLLNLNGGGNVGTSPARLNTTVGTLILGKTGGNTFVNETDALNLSGATGGGDIDVAAGGLITLNAALDAGAGTVTLAGPVDGIGLVTAGVLNLNGFGNVGSSLVRLNTTVSALVLGKTGGNTFVNETDALNLSGATGGGNLDVVAGATTTITAALNAGLGTVTLAGPVDGNGLITAGLLNLNGSGNVGSGAARLNTTVGSIVLAKTAGNTFVNETDALNLSGSTGGGDVDVATGGTTTINAALNAGAGTVTLAGAVGGNGLVTAGTLNLNGNGNVGAPLTRLNTAAGSIVLGKTGGNTFLNEMDAVTLSGTTGGGNLDLAAGGTTTIGAALNAGAGSVTLAGAVDGNGLVTAGALNLNGNGDVGSGLARLNTTVGSIALGKTGGNTFVNETDGLNLSGTTGGGNVDVLAGGTTTINAALNAGAGSVTLAGAVDGNGLVTAGMLKLNGNGNVGSGLARLNTTVGSIELGKTGGNTFVNESDGLILFGATGGGNVDVLAGGTTTINADLNVGAGFVTLSGAVDGTGLVTASTLNLNGDGNVGSAPSRLNTAVGSVVLAKTGGNTFLNENNTLNLSGSTGGGNLDVTAGGATTINAALNAAAGSVTLAGGVNGNGLVTAGTLNLNGNGDVGSMGARLNTAAGTIAFGKTGGDSFIDEQDVVSLRGATGGDLVVAANDFDITAGLGGAGNLVWLQPNAGVATISLGDSAAMGMTLTSGDLNNVTAGILRIGDMAVPNNTIFIQGPLSAANANVLSLKTSGAVDDLGAASVVNVNNVAVEAVGAVTLDSACHMINNLSVIGTNLKLASANPTVTTTMTLDGITGVPAAFEAVFSCGVFQLLRIPADLASLNVVDIPLPKLSSSTITFDTNVKGDLLENLIGPDSIWLSSLQVEFPTKKDPLETFRIEETSKWTRGILGISGSTQGPQSPR